MDLALGSVSDYTTDDKRQHFIAGYAIGATSAALVERIAPDAKPLTKFVWATIPAVLVGVAKEVADHQDGDDHSAEARDAIATAAGGAFGALCIQITLRF